MHFDRHDANWCLLCCSCSIQPTQTRSGFSRPALKVLGMAIFSFDNQCIFSGLLLLCEVSSIKQRLGPIRGAAVATRWCFFNRSTATPRRSIHVCIKLHFCFVLGGFKLRSEATRPLTRFLFTPKPTAAVDPDGTTKSRAIIMAVQLYNGPYTVQCVPRYGFRAHNGERRVVSAQQHRWSRL